jgi:hypothetical protein
MIDINCEEVLSLSDAAKVLPARRAGKKPHVSCLYRWSVGGCRGVQLESVQIGGTRCTSREALARFFDRLSGKPGDGSEAAPPSKPARYTKRVEAAERELDQMGI